MLYHRVERRVSIAALEQWRARRARVWEACGSRLSRRHARGEEVVVVEVTFSASVGPPEEALRRRVGRNDQDEQCLAEISRTTTDRATRASRKSKMDSTPVQIQNVRNQGLGSSENLKELNGRDCEWLLRGARAVEALLRVATVGVILCIPLRNSCSYCADVPLSTK